MGKEIEIFTKHQINISRSYWVGSNIDDLPKGGTNWWTKLWSCGLLLDEMNE